MGTAKLIMTVRIRLLFNAHTCHPELNGAYSNCNPEFVKVCIAHVLLARFLTDGYQHR